MPIKMSKIDPRGFVIIIIIIIQQLMLCYGVFSVTDGDVYGNSGRVYQSNVRIGMLE